MASRLNRHHPDWYTCYLAASFFMGDYERAAALFERAPDGLPEVRPYLAAAYALAGQRGQAKRHVAAYLRNHSLHWAGNPALWRSLQYSIARTPRKPNGRLRGCGWQEYQPDTVLGPLGSNFAESMISVLRRVRLRYRSCLASVGPSE